MPKYSYHCERCDSKYHVWHGMTEEHLKCDVCSSPQPPPVRIPSIIGEVFIASSDKVGTVVETTIEETKRETEKMKEKASRSMDI